MANCKIKPYLGGALMLTHIVYAALKEKNPPKPELAHELIGTKMVPISRAFKSDKSKSFGDE